MMKEKHSEARLVRRKLADSKLDGICKKFFQTLKLIHYSVLIPRQMDMCYFELKK